LDVLQMAARTLTTIEQKKPASSGRERRALLWPAEVLELLRSMPELERWAFLLAVLAWLAERLA
jgi:hypothetical protein